MDGPIAVYQYETNRETTSTRLVGCSQARSKAATTRSASCTLDRSIRLIGSSNRLVDARYRMELFTNQ